MGSLGGDVTVNRVRNGGTWGRDGVLAPSGTLPFERILCLVSAIYERGFEEELRTFSLSTSKNVQETPTKMAEASEYCLWADFVRRLFFWCHRSLLTRFPGRQTQFCSPSSWVRASLFTPGMHNINFVLLQVLELSVTSLPFFHTERAQKAS